MKTNCVKFLEQHEAESLKKKNLVNSVCEQTIQ